MGSFTILTQSQSCCELPDLKLKQYLRCHAVQNYHCSESTESVEFTLTVPTIQPLHTATMISVTLYHTTLHAPVNALTRN